MKCSICGNETRKNRPVCIGCKSVKDVARKGDKASGTKKDLAIKHLDSNPNLSLISWHSFSRRKAQL